MSSGKINREPDNLNGNSDEDSEWKLVPLGEVCKQMQYGHPQTLNKHYHGYATIGMNELIDGRFVKSWQMKYAEIGTAIFVKFQLNRDDILFCRANSLENVGRAGIFELAGDYCFPSDFIRITLDSSRAVPAFVNFLLNTIRFQWGMKKLASGPINQPQISLAKLRGFVILLPSVDTQRKILDEITSEPTQTNEFRELITRLEDKLYGELARFWGAGEIDEATTD